MEEKRQKKYPVILFLIIAALVIATMIGIGYLINNAINNSDNKPSSRQATNKDIYVTFPQFGLLSNEFKIKPNENIDNLELKFIFLGNEYNELETQTKNVGNVTKGNEFTVIINLNNFNIFTVSEIKYAKVEVIKGNIK